MDLKAIEFETVYKDGVISVPAEYRANIDEAPLKVIVLQPVSQKPNKPLRFDAFRIDTRGFKFDREEANER
ncbi:MAG: hypothetical protein LBT74_11055 [Acidobacteriota bacterium]|nr:hypothetical protein [Acidobacteriota bacterium]